MKKEIHRQQKLDLLHFIYLLCKRQMRLRARVRARARNYKINAETLETVKRRGNPERTPFSLRPSSLAFFFCRE